MPPDDVVVVYDIGEGDFRQTWDDCQQTDGYWQDDFTSVAWRTLHADEATGLDWPRWAATGWEMVFDGPLVARKTYTRSGASLHRASILAVAGLCGV